MKKPLDELYFTWLYGQVGDVEIKNPSRTYWKMLKHLYTKEFVWIIPNDDNRIEDGRDLRQEFVDDLRLRHIDQDWMGLPCSVLELMIVLSRRLAFEAEGEPCDWFWELIHNLGLDKYNDAIRLPESDVEDDIEETLDQVIFRVYDRRGRGGFFPLRRGCPDQRDVELWYQLSAYVLEKG